jgi:septal ring factor EnvC (AmiA/AmiB activator)
MSFEIKQMQKKMDDMHNKLHGFSEEMEKVRIERHKLKQFNDTMDRVSMELRGFRAQLEQLEKYSRNQHRRIRHLEDHLGVSRPTRRPPTQEKKNVTH